jgi:hypothetical protein
MPPVCTPHLRKSRYQQKLHRKRTSIEMSLRKMQLFNRRNPIKFTDVNAAQSAAI